MAFSLWEAFVTRVIASLNRLPTGGRDNLKRSLLNSPTVILIIYPRKIMFWIDSRR